MRRICLLALQLVMILSGSSILQAQDSTKPTPAVTRIGKSDKFLDTEVSLELLAGPMGVSFRAQKWHKLLEELDIPVRMRRGFGEEQNTGVTEKMVGTSLREVHIIGRIEDDATIVVGELEFQPQQEVKFREWIKELKTYGVQGAPEGQPIWGLALKQFEDLFAALSEPLGESFVGHPMKLALREMKLPENYPVHIDESARLILEEKIEVAIVSDVKGFSRGVALAIMLKEQGLGFYPRRTPEGTIELGIASREERDDFWPTGWPPQGNQFDLVPGLATLTDLEATDQPLEEFMQGIAEIVQLPILYDRFALERDKIDLANCLVNLPARRMTWITGLRSALFKNRLRPEIVTDEGGRPYLWVTSEKMKPLLPIPKE